MTSLLVTAVIGLIIGAVAKFVMPGVQGGNLFATMLVGLAGSLVANIAGQLVGLYPSGGGAGFVAAVIGALVVLWVWDKTFGFGK